MRFVGRTTTTKDPPSPSSAAAADEAGGKSCGRAEEGRRAGAPPSPDATVEATMSASATVGASAPRSSSPPPWPEDVPSGTLRRWRDAWTYGYMGPIFASGANRGKLRRRKGGGGKGDDEEESLRARSEGLDRQELTSGDLYRVPSADEASLLDDKFRRCYAETDGDFYRTLWRLAAPTFVPAGVCQLAALACQLSVPMCVLKLLQEIEGVDQGGGEELLTGAIPYVVLIFLLSVVNGLFTQRYQFLSYRSGIVVRTAVTCAVYGRALTVSPEGREGLTSGNVTNLVATDAQKLFEVMQEGHMIWSCPLAILVVVVLLLIVIGPSSIVGAAILVSLVPLSKKVAHIIVKIRRRRVAVADERVEVVAAMLQDIKATKLNGYEDRFEARVSDARAREMALVRKEQFVWGLTLVIRVFTPVLASFAMFVTYTLTGEGVMTASTVFASAMMFNMLKFPINQAGQLLSKAALGAQAAHRISQFMAREAREDKVGSGSARLDEGNVLEVRDGTFYVGGQRPTTGGELGPETAGATFALSNVNFGVARGEVLAVVGSVASGKSTLIQGLLGDVRSSDKTRISTADGAAVSYAAQTPFVLSATVRDNILFGSEFDEERYDRVLDACCLRRDLSLWPAGDLTEIGERGVTLSGGQKQRVSVARAVYAGPDVGLFDDVLSALDAGTSRQLFDNLFAKDGGSGVLRDCGVVLVTHAINVLRRVDKILVLDRGEAIFYGTYDELQSFQIDDIHRMTKIKSMRSSLQLGSDDDRGLASATASLGPSMITNEDEAHKGELLSKEEREHGESALGIWLLWFQYAGGIIFIVIQILLMACDRGSYVVIDWWLATWTSSAGQEITVFGMVFPNQFEGRSAQVPYVIVYTLLVVVMLTFLVARSQWAVLGGIKACERVFSNMTHRVLHAPMWYFDTTPLGRILNRFTYDVEQVDITLSQFMSIFIIACSWLVAGQVVMITLVPFMALVNAVVLVLYVLVVKHYRCSATDLQRLDAVSRSPIQASLAEGLDGSFTIRAFHKNDHFAKTFRGYLNDNSSAMLNFVASRRWLAVRLETLGASVTLAAGLCLTLFNRHLGLSPGLSGLLLVWANSFTVTLSFLITAFSEAEAAITSIERMHDMETLPQEKSMITPNDLKVDDSWPCQGLLEFKDVSLRYRPGLPLSLDGLTFTLQHGQRCAVVGRTGAGKSTLTAALFRLVEIESGTISLDGVDLSQLGLQDLRGRKNGMFILPQDPAIFAGTIRSNLDPFNLHNESDILRSLQLIKFPGVLKSEQLLEGVVAEGGKNLSAGEKQLLCLARAMLANPRLLILDEATSAVDGTTDDFVQQMLRSQFPDTTLLTIAHRLNTIIDYDVIIVMDKGRVAEFGSPRELLKDENGIFTGLVNATGPESALQLKMQAK